MGGKPDTRHPYGFLDTITHHGQHVGESKTPSTSAEKSGASDITRVK